MFYFILIILFALVFAYLGWRIWTTQATPPQPPKVDTYVCPHCNENHCDCHKADEGP